MNTQAASPKDEFHLALELPAGLSSRFGISHKTTAALLKRALSTGDCEISRFVQSAISAFNAQNGEYIACGAIEAISADTAFDIYRNSRALSEKEKSSWRMFLAFFANRSKFSFEQTVVTVRRLEASLASVEVDSVTSGEKEFAVRPADILGAIRDFVEALRQNLDRPATVAQEISPVQAPVEVDAPLAATERGARPTNETSLPQHLTARDIIGENEFFNALLKDHIDHIIHAVESNAFSIDWADHEAVKEAFKGATDYFATLSADQRRGLLFDYMKSVGFPEEMDIGDRSKCLSEQVAFGSEGGASYSVHPNTFRYFLSVEPSGVAVQLRTTRTMLPIVVSVFRWRKGEIDYVAKDMDSLALEANHADRRTKSERRHAGVTPGFADHDELILHTIEHVEQDPQISEETRFAITSGIQGITSGEMGKCVLYAIELFWISEKNLQQSIHRLLEICQIRSETQTERQIAIVLQNYVSNTMAASNRIKKPQNIAWLTDIFIAIAQKEIKKAYENERETSDTVLTAVPGAVARALDFDPAPESAEATLQRWKEPLEAFGVSGLLDMADEYRNGGNFAQDVSSLLRDVPGRTILRDAAMVMKDIGWFARPQRILSRNIGTPIIDSITQFMLNPRSANLPTNDGQKVFLEMVFAKRDQIRTKMTDGR